ncbi:hypothetical protein DVH24_034182 [Malus domestica]|uniref:Uncharacterized protein n=1 Tax=Malus domestica TaxID=3750 RepID=A0A498IAI3_MALDO|nr:hypothetical protein DVH24_034182 [Malus domestica]
MITGVTSQTRLHRSTILFALGPGHTLMNFLVDHPCWDCSRSNSLNFGVIMEFEASESPKCLVLYGGGHVHIRQITPSPLVDVGCYNWCFATKGHA